MHPKAMFECTMACRSSGRNNEDDGEKCYRVARRIVKSLGIAWKKEIDPHLYQGGGMAIRGHW